MFHVLISHVNVSIHLLLKPYGVEFCSSQYVTTLWRYCVSPCLLLAIEFRTRLMPVSVNVLDSRL